jgi:GNAT superfamily N-acetyltransferase
MTKTRSGIRAKESAEIKLLRETDLPAALQLHEREQWNQTASDWKRLLRLSPHGCFAAYYARKLIGTVTVMTYGRDLAWIGMMLVAQEYRGRGFGTQLMRASLDYCQRSRIATVKLDATPAGRRLYESLGFAPESKLERWQGAGRSRTQHPPESFGADKVRLSVYELDDQAFYAPRRELLNSLLQDCHVEPALQIDNSTQSLRGYALARGGARASYVGPIVAVERSLAISLLDSILRRLAGEVFLDVRIGTADIVVSLIERGFVKQRNLTRMSLGQQTTAPSGLVFAIAGPELG